VQQEDAWCFVWVPFTDELIDSEAVGALLDIVEKSMVLVDLVRGERVAQPLDVPKIPPVMPWLSSWPRRANRALAVPS
jgi:hypothetical protein